ncbi:ribosomal protein S5 domain 2-like protein [Pseudovirgaria hyperparasitica]|uniref:Ribosomal protein S5 domain 2-like protein n=1 Tax=Pseudovirgaria hyperparasitica TaxID=470096 RepID=A0A6A6W5F2_9PEZI|nr:ribosomal protein S5 domain 2-like protein [Pseudovirgaria hyperparasitica]KAF2757775.1 ribosomal protein S5 domain 2-like protein [Pseudovirgaria hyperparasitica]
MSLKRKAPDSSSSDDTSVYRSSPIYDRSSTFVAAYSPTKTAKVLQSDTKFTDASHRIAAWRLPSRQKSLFGDPTAHYDTRYDDDGEKNAGKRVARVLESMNVTGALVVARWYGGVMLGPVRFEHIENVAKEAVNAWKGAAKEEEGKVEVEKKKRLEEIEKTRLVRDLPKRDTSIGVLRGLLAEKKGEGPLTTPAKLLEYGNFEIGVLRRLEKARDTTIAWLLKSIDEAEAEAKAKSVGSGSSATGELGKARTKKTAGAKDAL